MTISSQFVQLAALVGALLPILVAFVQRQHFSNRVRVTIGVVSSLIAATVYALAQGKLTWSAWGAAALTIFLLAKVTYLAVWKPAGTTGAIEGGTGRRTR